MSTEQIQKYYFALYAKAGVEIFTKKTNKKTARFDDITFYDKEYYCAHLYPSTYEKIDSCEELHPYAKDCEEDKNEYEHELRSGEWVEDIHDCKLVCVNPKTGKEVDAHEFLEKKGYTYDWSESGCTKFSNWVDEDDLP